MFAGFSDITGISKAQSVKLASGFGGGMGGLKSACGAVTGMFMAADMLYGCESPTDKDAKMAHYGLIRNLAEKFQDMNGSIICRTLLEECPRIQKSTDITDRHYGARSCACLVGDAADILDEYIAKQGLA